MKNEIQTILEKLFENPEDLLDSYDSVEHCIRRILSKSRYDIEVEMIYTDKEQNKIYQVRWINNNKIEIINFIYTVEGIMKTI